jgi:hypothetical protein
LLCNSVQDSGKSLRADNAHGLSLCWARSLQVFVASFLISFDSLALAVAFSASYGSLRLPLIVTNSPL